MSFWRQLAQERELRGVPLEEVVERTKIARSTLERMESGVEDHLPPRVYLLGYLKSYAEAVGLDAEDVLLRFEEQSQCKPESSGDDCSDRGSKRGSAAVILALGAVVALLAAIAFVLVGD